VIIDDRDAELPDVLRQAIALVVDEVRTLEETIVGLDTQFVQPASAHPPVATRLQTIPGIGLLTASSPPG
jgi:transposase